ncbi:hypothetical protein Bhyg_08797, partial [Pseudolycoriella hygida]
MSSKDLLSLPSFDSLNLENVAERETTFSDLNQDCIESILRFISPNDLAAFSQTCRLYKNWAEQYFHRKWKFLRIHIRFVNGFVRFKFNEVYKVRFRSLFRFLVVEIVESMSAQMFQFIRDNCAKDLVGLQLYSDTLMDLSQVDGSIIAGQLKSVEVLQLHQVSIRKDIYSNFLKYCEEIQTLFIIPSSTLEAEYGTINDSWMTQRYSKLKSFVFLSGHSKTAMTPNLRTVTTDQLSIIKSLCLTEIDLDYAGIIFEIERNGTLKKIFSCKEIKSIRWMVRHECLTTALEGIPEQRHVETLVTLHLGKTTMDFQSIIPEGSLV